jgi:hypothetical protein
MVDIIVYKEIAFIHCKDNANTRSFDVKSSEGQTDGVF